MFLYSPALLASLT